MRCRSAMPRRASPRCASAAAWASPCALHATNLAALRDEKIISPLHTLVLRLNARPCAGRFILDVRQTARLIRSYIKTVVEKSTKGGIRHGTCCVGEGGYK